jgi:hypothetical protein
MSGPEGLGGGHRKIEMGSERSFGLVFAGVFALIALYPALHGRDVRFWALGLSAVMLSAAFLAPALLALPNRAWFKLGLLLGRVTTPIVMGILFFVAFVPIGMLLRTRGKDLLNLRRDVGQDSYWIKRVPPAPKAGSMVKQF